MIAPEQTAVVALVAANVATEAANIVGTARGQKYGYMYPLAMASCIERVVFD